MHEYIPFFFAGVAMMLGMLSTLGALYVIGKVLFYQFIGPFLDQELRDSYQPINRKK